jgi:hypothetical protein
MPTVKEVMDFNKERNSLLKEAPKKSYAEINSRYFEISDRHIRGYLMRTKDEQEQFLSFDGKNKCVMPRSCLEQECKEGKCFDGYFFCMQECKKDDECPEGQKCWSDGFCFLPPEIPCESVHSYSDDWLKMLNLGIFKPIVGDSDAHGMVWYEVGSPRNFVKSSSDNPEGIDFFELIDSIKTGHTFPTYGPFIDFTINGKNMGEIVDATKDNKVIIHITVQSPMWFDVSRVEVYRNGHLEYEFDVEVPNKSIVNLDEEIEAEMKEDSWFVVMAMGTKGRTLAPAFGSPDLFPVYLGDVFMGIFGGGPLENVVPSMLVSPKIPGVFPQFPFAISNPIMVDVDGVKEGCVITPSRSPLPSWACNADPVRKPCGCK